ncbi:MAG: hypothetical protein H6772_03410 [Pseudomonadales bacterium]|nr:hypothetical protein [Pseudomonadales bacterium]
MTSLAQNNSNLSTNNVGPQNLGQTDVSQNNVGPTVVSQSDASQTDVNQTNTNQTNANLNTLKEVLEELSSLAPQAVGSVIDQATDTLNPDYPSRSLKEKNELGSVPDKSSTDLGGGLQTIEHEKNPEIPVEVESFLQRVDDHQDQAPHEIVIADGTVETVKANYPSTPVVVLPITYEEEKEGEKKSPVFSLRWLVEWSHKIIKVFAGKVIYKEEQ